MKVNTINEKQVKQDLKTCTKSVKEYVKALENDIVRKQHLIDKALVKIKEQAKQLTIHSVVVPKGTLCDGDNCANMKPVEGTENYFCSDCGSHA